ncbi:MAG: ATP-dependent Clp protease adapter ClpS [Magnetococcus sp. WYHC-3]
MSDLHSRHEADTATRTAPKTGEPPLFKVVLLNDDFTPMDFVVDLIMRFFHKNVEEATRIMLSIHHQGKGICGVFPREIAETKALQVNHHARSHHHPLKCELERT